MKFMELSLSPHLNCCCHMWQMATRLDTAALDYLRCESIDKEIVFNKSLQILIRAKCFSVKLFLNKNENNGLLIQSKFNSGFGITSKAMHQKKIFGLSTFPKFRKSRISMVKTGPKINRGFGPPKVLRNLPKIFPKIMIKSGQKWPINDQ